jgi:hypothetical protein
MLALSGMAVLISAFRVAYVFPDKQSFVIGGISCLFDSSTVLFVIFEALNSSLGWGMKTLFTIYAVGPHPSLSHALTRQRHRVRRAPGSSARTFLVCVRARPCWRSRPHMLAFSPAHAGVFPRTCACPLCPPFPFAIANPTSIPVLPGFLLGHDRGVFWRDRPAVVLEP